MKSGSGSTTFPPGHGTTALKITAQVRARREACCRLPGSQDPRIPDATETEDRKSLGTIKVSRRVRGRAAKTGHFSNGMMAAHKLCKLLSWRPALHPGNDDSRRERGSGDTEHRDICVRMDPVYRPGFRVGNAAARRSEQSLRMATGTAADV